MKKLKVRVIQEPEVWGRITPELAERAVRIVLDARDAREARRKKRQATKQAAAR